MNEVLGNELSYQEMIQYFSDQRDQLSTKLQEEQDDEKFVEMKFEIDRLDENIQKLKDGIKPGSAGDGVISEGTLKMSIDPDPH